MNATPKAPGAPRCSNCGHDLTGAIESSRCPECGRPLVEVLVRDDSQILKLMGKRYTSKARLLGMPAISVALGVGPDGKQGHAKGWIAIGDRATGVVALGGMAMGVVAFGGLSLGAFTFGGLSVGLLLAFGGMACAPLGLALGGMAVGLMAYGGLAVGIAAVGGTAIGVYGSGPPSATFAMYPLPMRGQGAPEAEAFFRRFQWLFGAPGRGPMQMRGFAWGIAVYALAAAVLAIPALIRWSRSGGEDEADGRDDGNRRTVSER